MLTQADLKQLFKYNPATGELVRISSSKPVVSNTKTGYSRVRIGDKLFKTHRVIWLLVHGFQPNHIDHINGDRSDNRLANLRNITQYENALNQKLRADNVSGCSGVNWHNSNRWIAQIRDRGKYVYLGSFKVLFDAVAARKSAELKYGYHPNHGRVRARYERD